MVPDGRVSFPITHFLDLINVEKLLQNSKTSLKVKSSPKIPLMPEIVFFI
jgi:hypothetical protein